MHRFHVLVGKGRNVYAARILLRDELASVLTDLKRRAKRNPINGRCNLTLFRLACCCGLRCKEICGLDMRDVLTAGPQPMLRVRRAITKGRPSKKKGRLFPLPLDQGTLDDLAAWKACREKMGAQPSDPFLCHANKGHAGKRFCRRTLFAKWRTCIKVLGEERVKQLSIHKGRHTCASHLHAAGVPLVVIRDILGHGNIAITDIYIHALSLDKFKDVFVEKSHA